MANAPAAVVSNHPHPALEAEEVYRRWLQFLDEEFTRHSSPERRAEIVRDQLYQLYLGRPHGGKLNLTLTSELPGNVVSMSLDPENVTLEAGHFADVDRQRFDERKPLLWFWQMFDRSPIGLNHWLGLRFRCMLGRHIFAHMGSGVKIYHGVDLTYGYNLFDRRRRHHPPARAAERSRRHHHRQKRGDRLVCAHLLPHPRRRRSGEGEAATPTTIGDGARIGSHAIVLGGRHVGAGEVVGTSRGPAVRRLHACAC